MRGHNFHTYSWNYKKMLKKMKNIEKVSSKEYIMSGVASGPYYKLTVATIKPPKTILRKKKEHKKPTAKKVK